MKDCKICKGKGTREEAVRDQEAEWTFITVPCEKCEQDKNKISLTGSN